MGNIFARAWKGEASLAAAFWLIFFLFSIILNIILIILFSATMKNFNMVTHGSLVNAVMFPYTIYAAICVWRCGRNSNGFWRVISRIIIILAVLFGLLHIYNLIVGPRYVATPATMQASPTTAMQ